MEKRVTLEYDGSQRAVTRGHTFGPACMLLSCILAFASVLAVLPRFGVHFPWVIDREFYLGAALTCNGLGFAAGLFALHPGKARYAPLILLLHLLIFLINFTLPGPFVA